MSAINNGPSDDAWGSDLIDPVLVTHQSQLILFARARSATVGTLYFRVLDPSAASSGDDLAAWNGWYRYEFPEVVAAALPQNAEDAATLPARELRLAGMDLLTVTPVAEPVASADASFRVSSDGAFLTIYRQSSAGTLLMNRVGLLSRSEQQDGKSVERFALEPAWEVRFRRSGLRDVPLDEVDGEAFLDPTGEPFFEPTIEFARINGLKAGAYDVARVPSADPEIALLYAAVATATGVQLHQVRCSSSGLTDFTETPVVYPLIAPTLRNGGPALTPIAGLAPALVFYAEQERASTAAGNEAELQRAGHLMLAVPVSGGGLSAAVAVYDFALGQDGNISLLPASGQSLVLVDGKLMNGVFTPDTRAPAYPEPADLPDTIQIVDGLLVSSMVLGQLQPRQSPVLYFGDDGLVHLYFGGPLPTAPFDRWSSLDPKLPQAMVAQFDARANRLVLSVPWVMTEVEEQSNGAVDFYALQSGGIMAGATIAVADGTLAPNGPSAADLCNVSIVYPAVCGLPAETWNGVPRSLGPFMDVLNGNASSDSADPAVLSGAKTFFDYAGSHAIARLPLTLPAGVSDGPPPVVTFVTTRADLALASVGVTANGTSQDYTITFHAPANVVLTVHWRSVPFDVATFGDLFDGAAAPSTYAYPADTNGTPLFGLATNAVGIPAPVILYSLGTNALVPAMTITVAASTSVHGARDVTFAFDGNSVPINGIPADVAKFVTALQTNADFKALGLGIDGTGAAGQVQITHAPVGRMGLAATAALFDVLVPAIDLTAAAVTAGQYAAGVQRHSFNPASKLDPTRMAGFIATSLRPSAGATAYVQNTTGAVRSLSRALSPETDADALESGVWIRPPVQQQCSFSGTNNVIVPVTANGAVIPVSANLRPQWDWTLEAWVRPSSGQHQRLATFLDNVTTVPSGSPALAYALALESQQVVKSSSYTKQPGVPDSSYFQTGTSAKGSFMPVGAFTWEFWVKPNDQAAPPVSGATTPIGGVIQLGEPGRTPFLVVGLTADRHIEIATLDNSSGAHVYRSSVIVPAVDDENQPTWSHIALTGEQNAASKLWTLQILLDADITDSFSSVAMQTQSAAFLVIGANTPSNASLFGSMAQIRYWSIARSAADIRRTWLTSMSGFEPGLLGNWPLSAIETGGSTGKFVRNTAAQTSTDWDAPLFLYHQPLGTEDDSFFLSVIASVGGLASVEADTLLANGRWNHLALIYQAGGALAMNPAARYQNDRYDWVNCGPAGALGPTGRFAIDAWLEVPSGTLGQLGTIMARWANDDDPDAQSFMYWIDDVGEMHLSVAVITDDIGTVEIQTARSNGAALADGKTHHVAVVFTWQRLPGDDPAAIWTITFYKDGAQVGTKQDTIKGVISVDIRTTQGDVTIGSAFSPVVGAAPMAAEDFYYLRATLGTLRFWGTDASVQVLFPEKYPRLPQAGTPKGLAASWTFREQAGRVAFDLVGGNDATLSNSAMWASLADTSTLAFVANGAPVGSVTPATTPLETVSQAQFALGAPAGQVAIAGFAGDIAQVALYDDARSVETIQDQMFVPRYGYESGLIACWNFSDGGADITGGQNNIDPPVQAARLSASTAPLSNEGPYVRNAYGGVITDHSQSAPGRIATGSYADAQNVGTARQRGVLKRQYVVDPDQTLTRAIQIGELDLTYLGQVQTDPTLIGYIEGAPPVPGENLTRPYYLDPGNPSYMIYMDTATVSLVQEAAEKLVFTSSSSHATQIEASAAIGLLGIRTMTNLNLGAGPFSVITNSLDARGIAQAVVKGFGEIGSGDGEGVEASWSATQRDTMGVNGDWEPYQADQRSYLNPVVGRRFEVDNSAYALVESLSADLYAITFAPTKAAVGTIILPNPAIPPDRNIIVFPMNNSYTKNGTLDGKIGLINDPDYPDADARRGSFFKPVEAYALAASIDRQRQRSESIAQQFDPARKAHGWDTSLADARQAQSQDFSTKPGDPIAVATPVQGLVNRYVWTSNGGLHAEEQRTAASSVRSYSGNVARGGGGGFHADGEFFIKLGVAWSFDIMATHRVDVQVSKETTTEQSLSLDIKVAGDAYLRTFNPDAPAEYGGGKGAFSPGQAPGKVENYRFMTFYLPPSTANSANFSSIVDPTWIRLSNDPDARAMRQIDGSSPTWRVLHRVTYVQRIPPPIASRPVFTPASRIVEPVNVEGNAELIRLIDAQIPVATKERTRLIVGNAVATVLNPSPTAPGQYPPSKLEALVPWWLEFLKRARPGAAGGSPDPEAAKLLEALVSRTTAYMFDGYASGAFATILSPRPPLWGMLNAGSSAGSEPEPLCEAQA